MTTIVVARRQRVKSVFVIPFYYDAAVWLRLCASQVVRMFLNKV